ncbi:hypothetical protein [Nocardia sp. NRRL WC-3656]|uniref:hypothetical protein n=1 Tax=Nocardia sp. NRRL WC-3656 TaxID=1463824 RepID=UPI0004C39ECC|nr:hypothetical protein [Nocardia sp. NRRL WC-3656]
MRLTTADVTHTDDSVQLRLGRQPLIVASPLDGLLVELVLTRRSMAALGHHDDHNRWLFPGGLPGSAIHPTELTARGYAASAGPAAPDAAPHWPSTPPPCPPRCWPTFSASRSPRRSGGGKLADARGDTYAAELTRRHRSTSENRSPRD